MYRPIIFALFLLSISCSSDPQSSPVGESYPEHILANVYVDGKYGFINARGEFEIEPTYDLAFPFREGYACVNEGGQRNGFMAGVVGGMYYIIDTDGNKVAGGNAFKAPTAVRGGLINCEFFEDKKRGLIDLEGNAVASGFSSIGPFSEGLAAGVKKDSNLMGLPLFKLARNLVRSILLVTL